MHKTHLLLIWFIIIISSIYPESLQISFLNYPIQKQADVIFIAIFNQPVFSKVYF